MTKKQISNYFIEILKVLKIKTGLRYPDYIFYLYDDKVYIKYSKKNNIAWLDYDKIWSIFESNYSNNYKEIKKITDAIVKEHLKLKGVTTFCLGIPIL